MTDSLIVNAAVKGFILPPVNLQLTLTESMPLTIMVAPTDTTPLEIPLTGLADTIRLLIVKGALGISVIINEDEGHGCNPVFIASELEQGMTITKLEIANAGTADQEVIILAAG